MSGARRYPFPQPGRPAVEDRKMTTRRVMFWWFRFVLSGRFLDRFLSLPRAPGK
jgi:hypothetical protein